MLPETPYESGRLDAFTFSAKGTNGVNRGKGAKDRELAHFRTW